MSDEDDKKCIIDFQRLETLDGTLEMLDIVRDLLKARMTVKRYEVAESSTDEITDQFLSQGSTPKERIKYLRGYAEGIKMLAALVDQEGEDNNFPIAMIGLFPLKELRDKASIMWLAVIKQSVKVHQNQTNEKEKS